MPDTDPLRLRFDAFELDELDARLTHAGRPIALAPKAFAVLCALARQPGQLMTKNRLLDVVWGHQHVSESVLKTTISELRAALSDDARQPRYIETASRRGYRFIGLVNADAQRRPAGGSAPVAVVDAAAPDEPMLIGRRAALDQLSAAWKRAGAGRRQILWVAGEAGVGKTTLIDSFVAQLGAVTCARGQCVEQYGSGEPYLPVLDALSELCRADAAVAGLLRSVAPTWLLQLPWLSTETEREVLRRELAGSGQDRMLRELGELLDRYTQSRPVLLVTEDLHWCDHATVQLIDHIARRRTGSRLLWLGSFRLAEVVSEEHALKALRHELRLHRLCEEIVLDSFSEREVAEYVHGRFPEAGISEAFVRRVHSHTDGLPLFVVNVLDDLLSQGDMQAGAAERAGQGRLHVPENLMGIIEKQIARLPAELQTLLETASVCGVEFRLETVAHALERDGAWVGERCDELVRRQRWLNPPVVRRLPDGPLDARYGFRHALYRHVFYQRIGALTRAQLHRRVAESMERGRALGFPATAAEVASHYELSHDLTTALPHYAAAAESALRHFAPAEATALCAHALELVARLPAGPPRDALELVLTAMQGSSSAQLFGVSSPEANHAFERAQALLELFPQHPLRGMILHARGLGLMLRGEYAETRALGQRIHALSEASNDPALLLCACSLLGQMHALQGQHHAARDWLTRGIATCEALGDESLQTAFVVDPGVTLHAALAVPLLHLGFADQARARLADAHARARRLGQPMAYMVAYWFNILIEVRMQNPEAVAALAAQLGKVVEDAALAQGTAPSRWFRGWAQARLGAPQAGYELIRAGYEHNARVGMRSGAPEVLAYAAEALVLAGDLARSESELAEAMQLAATLDQRVYITQMLLLQGRIADARGDAEGGRKTMLAALSEARTQQSPWLELTALVALCERDGAPAEDAAALQATLDSLSEGRDTPLWGKAVALLGKR